MLTERMSRTDRRNVANLQQACRGAPHYANAHPAKPKQQAPSLSFQQPPLGSHHQSHQHAMQCIITCKTCPREITNQNLLPPIHTEKLPPSFSFLCFKTGRSSAFPFVFLLKIFFFFAERFLLIPPKSVSAICKKIKL